HREPLEWRDFWAWLFILMHSFLIVKNLRGNGHAHRHAYLYSRGFSRDRLWVHTTLAHVLAVMMVWLPAAVLVWSPARSWIQDIVFKSPYFPLFGSYEAVLPWVWLVQYAALMPMLHYAWIRRAQPTRGRNAGDFLCVAYIVGAFTAFAAVHAPWCRVFAVGVAILILCVMLVAGRLLNRTMEVY
ncbi:MAG: hypothetical protein GY851_14230, partial [bacterium]|nr:hypothetical protein [bacterium]